MVWDRGEIEGTPIIILMEQVGIGVKVKWVL